MANRAKTSTPGLAIAKRRLRDLFQKQGNPWHVASLAQGPMGHLHELASQWTFVKPYRRWAWCAKALLSITWPLRLAVQALPLLSAFSEPVRVQYGVSLWHQICDVVALGLGFGVSPKNYYQYQLFLPSNWQRLPQYLFDHEVAPLFAGLSAFQNAPTVQNKRLFHARCGEAALPTVPLLAWGASAPSWSAPSWPQGDLISKPSESYGARGLRLWQVQEDGLYRTPGVDTPLNSEGLLYWLAHNHCGQEWLVQPALQSAASLRDLSPGPLVTFRVITARSSDGKAEVFAALLQMPFGQQACSNYGIVSAVDLATGTLGRAFRLRPLCPGFDNHPDTGGIILGRKILEWGAIRDLALTAHGEFSTLALIGWDVALTENGLCLLEANAGWDVSLPQVALQGPLGETRFPQLCWEIGSKGAINRKASGKR